MKSIPVKDFSIGKGEPLTLICGPCMIENEPLCMEVAAALQDLPVNIVFKGSYDKANRSSIHSYRGPGIKEGLKVLEKVKARFSFPVTTDVHSPEEAREAAKVCDILQIPAFLCRQTDLVAAAAETGAIVSVKKGQFMAPWDMGNVVEKIREMGNDKIILIERGASFGYNNLVSDMRSIPLMQQYGVPVCFDATHSVQLPGGKGTSSGGQREFVPTLAKAAIASGANCLFMEAHPEPEKALSDAGSQLPLGELRNLVEQLNELYTLCQKWEK